LRAVLRLSSVPDYTTVYRFLRRLPDDTIESGWENRYADCAAVRAAADERAAVAVDGTGLSPPGVSTYFLRRIEQHGEKRYRHFLKWLVVADVDRQIILAQRARQGPRCDMPVLPSLVDAASRILPLPIGVVLADAEFDSEANHGHIRTILGAHSVIPTNP
jgi:hypothetical protein